MKLMINFSNQNIRGNDMNKTIIYRVCRSTIWAILCYHPLMSWAAPPTITVDPVTASEYRVVGITETSTDGRISTAGPFGDNLSGYAAADRLCQDEVAPYSRMATVREWQTVRDFPMPVGVDGVWLDPGPVLPVYRPDTGNAALDWLPVLMSSRAPPIATVATPQVARRNVSCASYGTNSPSTTGIRGDSRKLVAQAPCDGARPVACSALVSRPVAQ